MKVFFPQAYLKKVLPKNFFKEGLLRNDFTPKRAMLKALTRAQLVDGKKLDKTVYKALQVYKKKAKRLQKAGIKAFKRESVNGGALLEERVKHLVVWNKIQDIREEKKGKRKRFRWLASSAKEPRPEHQLRYGKIYYYDEVDELPGEADGCQCGIEDLD